MFSLPTFIFSVLFDARMIKHDTRQLARAWVVENIVSGSKINNIDLGMELKLTENKESIRIIKEKLPSLFSTARKYLLELEELDYPRPNYFVFSYKNMDHENYEFDYLILYDFEKDGLAQKSSSIQEEIELIKAFYPSSNNGDLPGRSELQIPFNDYSFNVLTLLKQYENYGPYVEIYKYQ